MYIAQLAISISYHLAGVRIVANTVEAVWGLSPKRQVLSDIS